MGPLDSPIARAINDRMAAMGGSPVRHKMVRGVAQFWVVLPGGGAVASKRLADLANSLGVLYGRESMSEAPFADPISRERASAITGYSTTAITRAAKAGEIQYHKVHARKFLISRSSATAWADKHRKAGGQFLPRRRKKHPQASANGATKRVVPGTRKSNRLAKYLAKLEGTPMQMSREDFVVKAVEFMLDRLEN